jgi:membrane protease YdiL (CAAX protease family)
VFGAAAAVIAIGLIAYSVLVEPIWGWFEYRRLKARRDSDPRALVRVHRIMIATLWSLTALVGVVVALSPALELADIGVRAPLFDDFVLAATLGGGIALVVSALAMRSAARKGQAVAGQAGFDALLPRTSQERRYAVAAAITAGVCEETLYRGFFIATGVQLFHLTPIAAAVATCAMFGIAHLYQGWRNALALTGMAAIMAIFYLRSASLLLPVILHALIDLRAFLLLRPGAASPSSPG